MNRLTARVLLVLIIRPLAWASWWAERLSGSFSRAFDEAQLADVFSLPAEPESTAPQLLSRSLRQVLTAARSGTSSDCRAHGGVPR